MLSVQGMEVRYGTSAPVLRGVDFQCSTGSLVCVLGSNGAGKTTLLRTISNTLFLYGGAATKGSITWNGREVTKVKADRLVRLGIVQAPEGRGIFAGLTVEENLRAGGFTRSRRDVESSLRECYEVFPEIADRRSARGGLLSGGQQQMLAIARALMAAPQLLLLDEPSLGLAPKMVDSVAKVIRQINDKGTAVVLVEQNAVMALDLADYAYVLEGGRIGLHGPAAELQGSDEVRRLYLGLGSVTPERDSTPAGGRDDIG